ncbi:MAG: transposase [Pyrinomonadaceae bacterium]|nr:transposase [Pyrinomonadaceae bacterium]
MSSTHLKFEWQAGYLGLTVSPSQIERVKNYVLNQEEHHRRQTFQQEYLEMLELSAIEYAERYMW